MLLKNKSVALTVGENGRGLKMTDLKRGTVWVQDESSVMWNGCIMHNDYPATDGMASMKAMLPVSAAKEGNDSFKSFSLI